MRSNRHWQAIYAKNPALAFKIERQGGFVTNDDIPGVVAVNRHLLLLVRCGNGRFLTPADNVTHFVALITHHAELVTKTTGQLLNPETDYVRDVALPAD